MSERTVTVGSLSKSHGDDRLALRLADRPEGARRHAERLALCMLYGQPGFIQEAALARAARGREARWRAMREIYRRRRDLVHAALARSAGADRREAGGGDVRC